MIRNVFCLVILAVVLEGCMLFKLERSEHRNVEKLEIGEDSYVMNTGEIILSGDRFIPSSTFIKLGDKSIYIDPLEINEPVIADIVFITHGHYDHLSIKDLNLVCDENTIVVAPNSLGRKLKKFNHYGVNVNETASIKGVGVESIPAYNKKPLFLFINPHSPQKGNVGYVLKYKEISLVYTGDTDLLEEHLKLTKIDVAILPVGGDGLTMNVSDALEFKNRVKPKIIIPVHYLIKQKLDLEALR